MERFAGSLELPQDVLLDLPKATLIGGLQLQIENHKGVLEYTPQKIRINTSQGEVVVTGARLTIGSIFQQELVIDGRISNVQLTK
jgi:sporulation protein YqfC